MDKPRIVMMDPARRGLVQVLDLPCSRASGEGPEVAGDEPSRGELRSKLTVMPFSRMSEVPAGGTGMSALPCASMSHQTVVPSCSYTLPDWSQRLMRV